MKLTWIVALIVSGTGLAIAKLELPTTTKTELAALSKKLINLPPRPFATDVVLMFIDPGFLKEKEFGAITAPLGAALQANKDNSAIIITTAGLMSDIIGLDKGPNKINYDPTKWHNFYITSAPDVYVLVPSDYKPERKIDPSLGRDFLLGLHTDRLTSISTADMLSQEFHKKHAQSEENFSKRFVTALENLFITKKEWGAKISDNYTSIPRYAFYLVGHGAQFTSIDQQLAQVHKLAEKEGEKKWSETISWLTRLKEKQKLYAPGSGGIIAGIENRYYARLMKFKDRQIITVFDFSDTCYGAPNLLEAIVAYRPNFIMVSGALIGAEVLGFSDPNDFDFATFTTELKSYNPIDFRKLLGTIYLFADLDVLKQAQKAANIPLLILPGQKSAPLDIPGQVVSIGKNLVEKHDKTSPLNISTYFAGRYLDKKSAEKASKKALIREEKRKKLYQEWLVERGLSDDRPIDPKIYKEWLARFAEFTKQHPKGLAEKAPDHVYPHAVLLYADIIPFALKFDRDPRKKAARPPALISMTPLFSYTELAGIDAPDFTITEIVKSSLLNFPSLEENRIFLVDKLIARNDIKDLGAIESSIPGSDSYFKVIAVNQAPQSGRSKRVERSALVIRYKDGLEQGAVKISFDRIKTKNGEFSGQKLAKREDQPEPTVKIVLSAKAIALDDITTEWDRFAQNAVELYQSTEKSAPPSARVSRTQKPRSPNLQSNPLRKLTESLQQLTK